jgi:Flp pilus assembly pilin Flp
LTPDRTPRKLVKLHRASGQQGQGIVEYSLIIVVMAVVCLISLVFFGDQLSSLLSLISGAV